ncbi:hypothetical protein EYC84_010029 [Monilinia fructicola]|uniref:DNA polymerase n=1 Tax=Monilinia fructicola TaxID=38448 RepID=A0A5M9JF32_MONFR|nr:hypothetical protein EYC84_010029 [Monilinia fructicola]
MVNKDSFFGQLYALNKSDSDSDSDTEPNESREFLKKCNNAILDPPPQREQSLLPPSPKELNALPPRKLYKQLLKNVPTLQRSHSEPEGGRKGDTLNKGAAKKVTGKKEKPLKLVPEKERIFEGLNFFFLPNDDKSPSRRARITKARERGATWVREVNEPITHLIIDESLTRKDVLTYLKVLPAGANMVNEEWLLDCIEQRYLYPPSGRKYMVKDPDAVTEKEQIPDTSASQQSNQSLQLKAPQIKDKKWEFVPPKQTPERMNLMIPSMNPILKMAVIPPSKLPLRPPNCPTGKGSVGNFQCMTGGTASDGPNPNDHTIEILSRMRDYYERTGDQWRARSYLQACGQLKNQPTLIRTFDEAIVIPKIGQRIAQKIEEIVLTGRLLRLEHAEAEPDDQILKLFMGIYGVNIKLASKIGIEHYDDLQLRIPRDEVTALGNFVSDTAHALDPDIEITIGGSYRRGANTSGDIDIIISKPNTTRTAELTPFLSSLVKSLTDSTFLVAALAVPHNREGSKWHGCCVLSPPSSSHPKPQPWRRIDFLLVPSSELGAGLIYFTGDDIFNRSMRLLAGKKGMRLNQRGLYRDVMRERGARKTVTGGTLLEGRDERKIFELLAFLGGNLGSEFYINGLESERVFGLGCVRIG